MFVLGKNEKLLSVALVVTLILVGCGGGDSADTASSSAEVAVVENPVDPVSCFWVGFSCLSIEG